MSVVRTRPHGEGRGDRAEWLESLERLRAAASRGERSERTEEQIERLRRWVSEWGDDPSPRQRALARQALADIKVCAIDPRRSPDAELWRALGPLPAPAPPPREPSRDAALAGLAQADDDEVDQLLASLGEEPAPSAAAGVDDDDLGSLREPLAGSRGREEARVLMKGDLQAGLLSDVIQMFAQNNETGRLVVQSLDGGGAVYFDTGRIVDATYGAEVGEPAFHRIMRLTHGRFAYERGVRAAHARISCSVQHLILDALRVLDEAAR